MPPAGEGEPSVYGQAVACADGSRKDAKKTENPFVSCLERIPHLIVTPLRLPGEAKGLGDEVGEHAQIVFCELHRER